LNRISPRSDTISGSASVPESASARVPVPSLCRVRLRQRVKAAAPWHGQSAQHGENDMSNSEFARFLKDLGTDTALQAAVKPSATNPAALVEIAKGKGYAIDVDDVRAHLKAGRPGITEKELEAVVGGKAKTTIVIGINNVVAY
jgi:predicted ribosomally synthesized peptide with nif11-like leader